MKIFLPLFILFFFFTPLLVFPQGPNEKIYIQTDRDFYVPGETISFNGFVLTGIDTIYSGSLFVELWDDSLRKRAELILPVIDGSGSGAITIPRELKTTRLFLRAYSDITARQMHPFQYVKAVMCTPQNEYLLQGKTGSGQPEFFPEGGRLVYNALNHVAFKANENFRGTIRNNKGKTVADITPLFNGLGTFILTPERNETYTCYWDENGKTAAVPLPLPVENGIALHVKQTADTLYMDLDKGESRDPQLQHLKIHLMINNEIAYLVELNLSSRSRFSYFIPLGDYRAGMAELRVLGGDAQVLASRPVFINRHSLTDVPELDIIKKDFSARGENRYRLQFKDTSIRLLSVSITDAAYSDEINGSGLAASFITPVSQPVPAPFLNISKPEQFDLAVQTSGLPVAMPVSSVQSAALPQGKYLQLEGTVMKGRKLLTGKNLLVGLRSAYAGKELYKVRTDDQGKFVLDGLIAIGEIFVHCRLPGNELQGLNCIFNLRLPVVNPAPDFYNQFEKTAKSMLPVNRSNNFPLVAGMANPDLEDTLAFSDKTITLSEVVLKSGSDVQARKRLQELEEKYIASGLFSGYAATGETLDVMNDPGSIRYFDLFSYIRANMKRVDVRTVNGTKQLMYFGRGVTGEMMVTTFYIDNSVAERYMLDAISLDQVAAIKFVPNLAMGKELPPALAIFLKKSGDQGYWEKDRYQVFEQKINGYPVSKEFMEPDYSNEETKAEKDWRKTISWKPYTVVDRGVAEIRFFNTDRTKKFRIMVEGIAEDGSLIFFEKEIE